MQTEYFFKVHVRMLDHEGISAIPPNRYKERFLKRVIGEYLGVSDMEDIE